MASAITAEVTTATFERDDGVVLAYHEVGNGRPLVLLHGYMFPAKGTWVATGIAGRLAQAGRRVVMLDMRGHGESAKPHDGDSYPCDALTTDAFALIAHLGLADYDLGGYSLGARVAARMLALGARPRRAVLGGTGLDPIVHLGSRGGNYRRIMAGLGTFEPGSSEAQLEAYLKATGGDPVALAHVLDTFVDTAREALAAVEVPTLVIAGEGDNDRGSVSDLAALLRNARLVRVPGDHFSALSSRELADELVRYLDSAGGGSRDQTVTTQ